MIHRPRRDRTVVSLKKKKKKKGKRDKGIRDKEKKGIGGSARSL